jgi:subtilase family serine protease
MKTSRFLRIALLSTMAVVVLVGVVCDMLYSSSPAQAAGIKYDPTLIFGLGAHPYMQYVKEFPRGSLAVIPPCLTSDTAPRCFSPAQLHRAYNIPSNLTGKGRTIVLIDVGASPTIADDLHLYDQLFGLGDPTLNIIEPFGKPPVNFGSDVETALDVESAHSMAPDATIDVVLADVSGAFSIDTELAAILRATKYAVDNNLGDVISLSFGAGESCVGSAYLQAEQQVFADARAKGITILASSGDYGVANYSCIGSQIFLGKAAIIPGSDPLVTSVGGTTLDAAVGTGQYVAEVTWNEWNAGAGATGGGFSDIFARPGYQNGIPGIGATRGLPDVAFDADPFTGVPVVISIDGETIVGPVGGTSVGAPEWAGIVALADQAAGKRLGFLNPALYRIGESASSASAFHDITVGNNTVTVVDPNSGKPVTIQGYDAGTGWDAVTGFGTPKVDGLIPLLVQAAA